MSAGKQTGFARWILWLGCIVAVGGCSTASYQRSADTEVYGIITQKSPMVTNMEPRFSIEQTNALALDGLPIATGTNEFLGQTAEAERGAPVLSLQKALEVAVQHSRSYQNNREQLYLAALSLTLSRHEFAPIFSSGGAATYQVTTSDNLAETHSVSGSGNVGVNWLIRDLGRISAAFTTDFLRFVGGDPSTAISSQIGATFARPLLRNAGYKAEIENLTQAERSLLYQLRDYTRFRKDFSVQIASAYYNVLGDRDAARNSFLNLQSSRRSAERGRAMAAEGRQTQTELGRLEQQELSAESSWIGALRTYLRALDDFKILLGIPMETKIALDDRELEQLRIRHPEINVEDSVKVALAARLDYQNLRDQQDDNVRKVRLAADRLKPQLDLTANAGIASAQQSSGFAVPELRRYNWNAGLNLDLPLERKAERNNYRSALIAQAQSERALDQLGDQIELQIRDSWRTLEQARRTYEINVLGVQLAERRVEEQDLKAEFGRANALDQVDAQNALNSSKDQRTQALVAHTIARLQFWNNMGILYITDNGQWEEVTDTNANNEE